MIGSQRRAAILDALRRGTVPREGLDAFAVGVERFETAFDSDLAAIAGGRGAFKAVRGEYGSGKTFMARWLQERARAAGFATSEVQINETETPLHRWETVYRRLVERLATSDTPEGALRPTVDAWFYTLEEDVLAEGRVDAHDTEALAASTEALMERRLAAIARTAPAFSAVLRAYRRALLANDTALSEGLMAWLGGQPNVAAAVKRAAGVKGDLDAFGAMHFLAGLLTILRDSGRSGLVLVLDEAETLQRMRADTREKGLNALRQLLDELDAGRYPGLYLVVTGTTAFFEGPQGVQRLPPLAQRLHTDFATDARFDNPRAVQIRLQGFDLDALAAVGRRVRDIFAEQAQDPARISATVDDGYVADLARGVAGRLGGRAGVAPRLYLRKLVAEVLDRVDQFADFDPRRHYAPTVDEREMTRGGARRSRRRRRGRCRVRLVTAAFDALHPALRYHIVSTLGWSDLRPTQAEAVGPLMAGEDVLLLAPTAGGKTEAAAFPLLSLIASQGWRGLSALYVCPLKALLNNLAPRLERYAGFLGMRVGLWHGDVGEPARRRMLRDPPEILLTTPESLRP